MANAGVFLDEKAAASLFSKTGVPGLPAPVRDVETIRAMAERAIEYLRDLRARGHRLRPYPNGYLAPHKEPYARVIGILEAAGPTAIENYNKTIYRVRNADGIVIAMVEYYARLASNSGVSTVLIALGIKEFLEIYRDQILPKIYEWEYVEEVLGKPTISKVID